MHRTASFHESLSYGPRLQCFTVKSRETLARSGRQRIGFVSSPLLGNQAARSSKCSLNRYAFSVLVSKSSEQGSSGRHDSAKHDSLLFGSTL